MGFVEPLREHRLPLWLALFVTLLTYPTVGLPRAVWVGWRARRRLRAYGTPLIEGPVRIR